MLSGRAVLKGILIGGEMGFYGTWCNYSQVREGCCGCYSSQARLMLYQRNANNYSD